VRIPKTAVLLAGIVAGLVSRSLKPKENRRIAELKRSVDELGARVSEQAQQQGARLERVEARLDEHEARLNDVPSTAQIVTAMEDLLSKTMGCLDERLSAQAQSIDVLKTTVSQTDELLERVLNSIDALRSGEAAPPRKPLADPSAE